MIQVNQAAENAILLYPGANHGLTEKQVDQVLANAGKDDWVLLQNETNQVSYIIEQAHGQGVRVAFNPAPMDTHLTLGLLNKLDLLIINEVEAMDLMQVPTLEEAKGQLQQQYPQLAILMTLGSQGVCYLKDHQEIHIPAFKVEAVDTTAAGDTFIGFVLAAFNTGMAVEKALQRACAASALCVTVAGAAPSIPDSTRVDEFLRHYRPKLS